MSEPHARFQAWLLAGAEGDPPRDLAVHASVCAACRASIAAFDRLAFVDPGAANIPALTRPVTRGVLVRAGRALGATFGVLIAATVLGVGGWQLIAAARGGPDGIARASGTPNQVVLAGSGTPGASGSQEASGSAVAASASEMPTASPSGNAPAATPRPGATATPGPVVTPRPTATAQPTALSTPQQTVPPTSTLGASPSPASTAGPTPTPPPVPTATPSPTPAPTPAPGAPTLVQAVWDGVSAIHLSWSAPSGGPVDYYEILRSSSTQTETLYFSPVLGTTFDDGGVATGEIWYYEVRAVGPGGTGAVSNELSETVP